jgi:hypothetical protein
MQFRNLQTQGGPARQRIVSSSACAAEILSYFPMQRKPRSLRVELCVAMPTLPIED